MFDRMLTTHQLCRLLLRSFPVLAIAAVCVQVVAAQGFTTTNPGDIMHQFRSMRTTWMTNVWVFANRLFGILAVIEFAWSAIVMALDKSDMQSWTAALVRRIMWIGAFYALLINGRYWIPAIISSFEVIGQTASGTPGISPSDVFAQGIDIAGALMDAVSTSAFFTNPGSSLALALAAILIVISYVIITLNYIVTMVESYLVISAGFIMLGFGGSRWTAPYVERYIGLAVSIGIKIVLIYCLVAAGFGLGVGWLTEAQGVGTSPNPAMTAFDVMGAAIIFMMLCWQIPKLFGAVLGGSPALTGGDLVGTGAAVIGGAVAVGAAGAGAIAAVAGGTAAAGGSALAGGTGMAGAGGSGAAAAGSTSGIGSVGSASLGSAIVPPPTGASPSAGTSSAASRQPEPPTRHGGFAAEVSRVSSGPDTADRNTPGSQGNTSAAGSSGVYAESPSPSRSLANLGGEALAGSGFEQERSAKGFVTSSAAVPPPAYSPSSLGIRAPQPPPAGSGQGSNAPVPDVAPGSVQSTSIDSASAASDVSSVHSSAGNPQAPSGLDRIGKATRKTENVLRGTHDRLRDARLRIGRMSDAAPPPSPPRMPIDHDND